MTRVHSDAEGVSVPTEGQASGNDFGAVILKLIDDREMQRERAVRAEVLLKRAADFIADIGQDLHSLRATDWFPEAAQNAAASMSEDMRLLGNACADFNPFLATTANSVGTEAEGRSAPNPTGESTQ